MPDTPRRDPYWYFLGALALSGPVTALHYWSAWDSLPERMATHFDGAGRANGWSTRADGTTLGLGMLVFALFVVIPGCALVRRFKPSHSWPVLVIAGFAVGVIVWGANAIVWANLSR